ncbi:MAG TPA: chemotaxis protein CheA, partial [Bacteroidales bacterium]|nr:chemotaxis protein CheA [Bacteroidales bacterium]
LLSSLDSDLLALENNPVSKPHIDQVFRTMHTIKGASGMYGFDKIMEVTHEVETLYDLVRENKLDVSKALIDLTLAVADHIRNLLNDPELRIKDNIANHTLIIQSVSNYNKQAGVQKGPVEKPLKVKKHEGVQTWQIVLYPDEKLIYRGVNLSLIIGDLHQLGKCVIHSNVEDNVIAFWNIFVVTDKGQDAITDVLMFISDNCKVSKIADFDIFDEKQLDENEELTREKEASYVSKSGERSDIKSEAPQVTLPQLGRIGVKNNGVQVSHRIHVDASKLDTLMYLVTELVTSKSELLLAIQKRSDEKIIETAEKIEKLSKLFSDNALSIRLVSLQEMLLRYQRLIRDLSNTLGKKVNFSIKGETIELDKNIVDIVAEPIMHLIRNCIDHGIEMPEKRKLSNKDETGIIYFNAYESGNNVFIEVGDDGTGIDIDYVYRKAVDMGFIQPEAMLSEKEIFDLIFLPGFSTAQSLTEVSGRGVGMDIVRKKIHEIRGEIFVQSKRGKGTTFTIKLQQTISIIDTLLIRADKSVFAIPMDDIEACNIENHSTMCNRQNKLIPYNGELIPFICLRTSFGTISESPEKEKLIIISKQGKKYAIVADDIIGQHQAVIKPMSKAVQNADFISGASILGDGAIALLLDTEKLKATLAVTAY